MKLFSKALLLAGTALLTPSTSAFAANAESNEAQALAPDNIDNTIIVTGNVLQSNEVNSVKTPTPIIDVRKA